MYRENRSLAVCEDGIGIHGKFDSGREVVRPAKLFGRTKTLNLLKTALLSGIHTEVVSERKFGKSSLLHCIVASLGSEQNYLAVEVGVHCLECSGWSDFYAWLTAHILVRAIKQNQDADRVGRAFGSHEGIRISPETDEAGIFSQIRQTDAQKVISAFRYLIAALAGEGISIILLLDEIQTAVRYFDGNGEGFYHLRDMAMQDGSSGVMPLTVCIASTLEWQDIIPDSAGSPALNFFSNQVVLGGVTEDDARLLLRRHAAECEPPWEIQQEMIDTIRDVAGCYPYYLKVAAEKAYDRLMRSGRLESAWLKEETYAATHGHLTRYIAGCSTREKNALARVISSRVDAGEKRPAFTRLFRRGLLTVEDGTFRPFNSLFREACTEFLD